MSERTGLLDLEVRLLEIVEEVTNPAGEPVSSTAVLAAIEAASLLGPRHAYPLLVDLAVPWRRHLPLLSFVGNGGSPHGDEAAEARYTMVGLADAGRLALAAERGEVGPVPFGLVDGSWWRGGLQPPYDPGAVLAALGSGEAAALVPSPIRARPATSRAWGGTAGPPGRLGDDDLRDGGGRTAAGL